MGDCVPDHTVRNNQTSLPRLPKFAIDNTCIAADVTVDDSIVVILGTPYDLKRNIKQEEQSLKSFVTFYDNLSFSMDKTVVYCLLLHQ